MLQTGKPLSTLRQQVILFPQETLNLRVAEKIPLERLRQLPACIARLQEELGDDGRVLVRYSGTEPKLRMLVEGKDHGAISTGIRLLEEAARSDLDVVS